MDRSQDSAKPEGYYGLIRTEILPFLPPRFPRVLDVGCGEGATARYLRDRGYCEWTAGIERSPHAAQIARANLDLLIEADIESSELPAMPPIDVILCLDVLEHLVDPWSCVDRLRPLLSPTGMILASIPNVRNLRVLLPLILLGRWDYKPYGILDDTHLRFFTYRSAITLLDRDGLVSRHVGQHYGRYLRFLNPWKIPLFADFMAIQFFVRAARPPQC